MSLWPSTGTGAWRPPCSCAGESVAIPCLDTHGLELAKSGWRLLGGGGGTGQDYLLAARPQRTTLGAAAVEIGRGSVVRHADRLMPGESGWVRWVEVRAAAEVARLQVSERPVPVH